MNREEIVIGNKADIGHEIGEHYVQPWGLDIHNPVFVISATLVVALLAATLLFPHATAATFIDLRLWITSKFDWFFLLAVNIFTVFLLLLACSRLGRVRLGGPEASPHCSYLIWFAMLFAAGVGIGLMFFGVLEPVTHTLNPPLGIGTKIILILSIISIAMLSVYAGLDKGVKRLSELNLGLAGMLMLFVLIAGPTWLILMSILQLVEKWTHRYNSAFSGAFCRAWLPSHYCWGVASNHCRR